VPTWLIISLVAIWLAIVIVSTAFRRPIIGPG
jgi:hypothetical protein